jgi:hypothetical protein
MKGQVMETYVFDEIESNQKVSMLVDLYDKMWSTLRTSGLFSIQLDSEDYSALTKKLEMADEPARKFCDGVGAMESVKIALRSFVVYGRSLIARRGGA